MYITTILMCINMTKAIQFFYSRFDTFSIVEFNAHQELQDFFIGVSLGHLISTNQEVRRIFKSPEIVGQT